MGKSAIGTAVVNVDAYIVLNGFCMAGSNGGNLPFYKKEPFDHFFSFTSLRVVESAAYSTSIPVDRLNRCLVLSSDTSGWGKPGRH